MQSKTAGAKATKKRETPAQREARQAAEAAAARQRARDRAGEDVLPRKAGRSKG